MNECKPLAGGVDARGRSDRGGYVARRDPGDGAGGGRHHGRGGAGGRGLHSSTFLLDLSALYGIGGVHKRLCSLC